MRKNMNTNEGIDRKLSGGGHKLNDNSHEDSEVEISNLEGLFYDVPTLSEEEQKEIDKMIKEVEDKGFKDKFFALAEETERKRKNILKIGSLHISKAACMIVIICLATVLLGVTVYAAVRNYIKSIQVEDLDDHSEIEIQYNDVSVMDTVEEEKNNIEILEYYDPTWIPEGYSALSETKDAMINSIVYESAESGYRIVYHQTLPSVKKNYNSINGRHENVKFGIFVGEFIETDKSNYLIVTDGVYLYDIIADNMNKDSLIRMLNGDY